MENKILLVIIAFALSNSTFGQNKIKPDLRIMTFLGRIPEKTKSNSLPDNLLRILYFDAQPEGRPNIGYMNLDGEILLEPIFNMGSDFYGEAANIIIDSTFGYVNKKGIQTLFDQYKKTFFYYGDIGIAKKGGKFALINRKGDPLTAFKYTMINFFGFNFFQAYTPDKMSVILNGKGEIVFNQDKNFNIQSHFFKDSLLAFQETINGKKLNGLVNINGEIVLKPTYEKIQFINDDEFFAVMKDEKWGFIDKEGNEIIPLVYDKVAFNINDDLIPAKKNNKWGYINRKNKLRIPFIYEKAHAFLEGLAFVKKNGFYGCINKQNEVKIDFKLEETNFPFFSNGLALFKKNEKYGFINKKGKLEIPAIYDTAYPFFKGRANVELNGEVGQINTMGEEIIPIKYKQLWFASEGFIRFAD